MKNERRKRRQTQRRLKRDVMQNHMVLRGWSPVKCGGHYGLVHVDDQRLVVRRWGELGDPKAVNAPHPLQGGWQGAAAKRATSTSRTGWSARTGPRRSRRGPRRPGRARCGRSS